jgi:hypothetical protein
MYTARISGFSLVGALLIACSTSSTSRVSEDAGTANASTDASSGDAGASSASGCPTKVDGGTTNWKACMEQCSPSCVCDLQATPPICAGGRLKISCSGSCVGAAGASVQCFGGTCTGNCMGTCDGAASTGKCAGLCTGSCDAACKASAGQTVACEGACDAAFDIICCDGGTMQGGCAVDAKCAADCQPLAACK